MSRYESKEVRAAKARRRELLRPLRAHIEGSGYSVRIPPGYVDRVYIDGHGTAALTVYLGEVPETRYRSAYWITLEDALTDALFDWMDEDLDSQERYIDSRRARVDAARARFEEVTA